MTATAIAPEVPSIDTFGGNFRDYDAIVDPQTEMGAVCQNRLAVEVVAHAHTKSIAWARVTVAAGVATLAAHSAVWGATGAVAPTVTRLAAGQVKVEWAAQYNDLRTDPNDPAEAHPVNIQAAFASGYAAAGARIVNAQRVSAVRVDVWSYDAAGLAADLDSFSVEVKLCPCLAPGARRGRGGSAEAPTSRSPWVTR